jgi:hypothetical protein
MHGAIAEERRASFRVNSIDAPPASAHPTRGFSAWLLWGCILTLRRIPLPRINRYLYLLGELQRLNLAYGWRFRLVDVTRSVSLPSAIYVDRI